MQAGKCGALYGVASSGKSRLVEFMGRPDVRHQYQHYFHGDWMKVLFPWVDGNDLLERTEWGLYEKILAAVSADLDQLPEHGGEARLKVQDWYWKLVQPENKHLARRMLMYALDELPEYRVVLLLDDLEDFIAKADEEVFRGLRSLRDRFKRDNQYRLLYLLFERRRLPDLRDDENSAAFDSFLELFKNFTCPIGCYNHDDALSMIHRLAEAYTLPSRALTPDTAEQLIEVTGGHAGLIDASFHSDTESNWTRFGLPTALIQAPGVWNECVSIYESLSEEQRLHLIEVAHGGDPGLAATHLLEEAGLVRRRPSRAPQTIELLRLFLVEQDEHGPRIQLHPERRAVSIDRCTVEWVEREFRIMDQLHQRRGQDCRYFELHEAVTPQAPFDSAAQEEMTRLLHRLENKLLKGCRRRIIIHTPGRSCRLIGPEGH
jgi:hypothetical protein